jgi:hypothetical protein
MQGEKRRSSFSEMLTSPFKSSIFSLGVDTQAGPGGRRKSVQVKVLCNNDAVRNEVVRKVSEMYSDFNCKDSVGISSKFTILIGETGFATFLVIFDPNMHSVTCLTEKADISANAYEFNELVRKLKDINYNPLLTASLDAPTSSLPSSHSLQPS